MPMRLSPPFVIRITDQEFRDRYHRDSDGVLQTFPTMKDAFAVVDSLRPFPVGEHSAVAPLASVPESER